MNRAKYRCSNVGGVFAIIDENGPISVTNDIETVIDEVMNFYDIDDEPIIYCDSEGRWDGIELDDRGRFKDFILLGAPNVIEAIAALKRRQLLPGETETGT
jgi:hypothetical protein